MAVQHEFLTWVYSTTNGTSLRGESARLPLWWHWALDFGTLTARCFTANDLEKTELQLPVVVRPDEVHCKWPFQMSFRVFSSLCFFSPDINPINISFSTSKFSTNFWVMFLDLFQPNSSLWPFPSPSRCDRPFSDAMVIESLELELLSTPVLGSSFQAPQRFTVPWRNAFGNRLGRVFWGWDLLLVKKKWEKTMGKNGKN